MIRYQEESFIGAKEDFAPLLQLHWEEIARHTDTIKLNVDYATYAKLEDAGVLHTVTARDDGKLIGYIISFVAPNLHYKDHVMANNDVLFVHPDYRRGGTFIKMLKLAESLLRKRGVTNFYIHMKITHDFSVILDRMGYTEIEHNFEKQLQVN